MTQLQKVLSTIPLNTVVLPVWFSRQGISKDLRQSYRKNGWLTPFGRGAYSKLNEKPTFEGAIYALQEQASLHIHIGGKSALALKHNISHYASYSIQYELFATNGTKIPQWFESNFKDSFNVFCTDFLPYDIGLVYVDEGGFSIKVSSPERAFLEMLYLTPKKNNVDEDYKLLEMMPTLSPTLLQSLLENCKSVKVCRLFFYLAEQLNYSWLARLDKTKINFGSGVRVINKSGMFDKNSNLVVNKIYE